MIAQKFEIRVALLGYVSVGKTTVLNALFRDKFSEVSMRRTTAGVNFFRIVTPEPREEENNRDDSSAGQNSSSSDVGHHWSVVADDDETTQNAAEVLEEIEAANRELREAGKIVEKKFNVELETPLCDMRKDTVLEVVDIPGINEAHTNSIYMNYVNENWKNFDCIVAVMDARQGVNTEEQLNLLRLIKTNLSTKKDVPVIILFNKVDEPDDSEQALLVSEARDKIAEMFKVDCSEKSFEQVLHQATRASTEGTENIMYPVFIPTSAVHAFFYRTASLLTYEQFKDKFELDLLDKIGREEAGRFRWKKLSAEEKYQAVFDAVSGDSNYEERLKTTNFDKFLKILCLAVGGEDVQRRLLQKQLDVALQSLKSLPNEGASIENLRIIYDRCVILEKDTNAIKTTFWSIYDACEATAMQAFEEECDVEKLTEPPSLLQNYLSFATSVKWEDEMISIREHLCNLARQQLAIIVKKQDLNKFESIADIQSTYLTICPRCPTTKPAARPKSTWEALTYFDWLSILDSLLLLSFDRHFCEEFGREKIFLSNLKAKYCDSQFECMCSKCDPQCLLGFRSQQQYCAKCGQQYCPARPSCRQSPLKEWNLRIDDDGEMKASCDGVETNITVPASLSDGQHWGHVAWMCCKMLDVMDKRKA